MEKFKKDRTPHHVSCAYYPLMKNSPSAQAIWKLQIINEKILTRCINRILSIVSLALSNHKKAQEDLKELQIIIDCLVVKNNPVHELGLGKLYPRLCELKIKAGNAQEELHCSMDHIEFYSTEDTDKKIAKMKQMIHILDTKVLPALQARLASMFLLITWILWTSMTIEICLVLNFSISK